MGCRRGNDQSLLVLWCHTDDMAAGVFSHCSRVTLDRVLPVAGCRTRAHHDDVDIERRSVSIASFHPRTTRSVQVRQLNS